MNALMTADNFTIGNGARKEGKMNQDLILMIQVEYMFYQGDIKIKQRMWKQKLHYY